MILKQNRSSTISCSIWMAQKAISTQVSNLLLTCLNVIFKICLSINNVPSINFIINYAITLRVMYNENKYQ